MPPAAIASDYEEYQAWFFTRALLTNAQRGLSSRHHDNVTLTRGEILAVLFQHPNLRKLHQTSIHQDSISKLTPLTTSRNLEFYPVIQLEDTPSFVQLISFYYISSFQPVPPVATSPHFLPPPLPAAKRLHGLRGHGDEEARAVHNLGRREGGHVGPQVIRLAKGKLRH